MRGSTSGLSSAEKISAISALEWRGARRVIRDAVKLLPLAPHLFAPRLLNGHGQVQLFL